MISVIESLLFVAGDEGLTKDELGNILNIDKEKLDNIIISLENKYDDDNSGIELKLLGNSLKLVTKLKNKDYLQRMVDVKDNDTLTEAALETLAIIAYNQPITRIEVDEIRGVSSAYLIRKLVYKDLVEEIGRSEIAGRPILYGTSDKFLDYFGLNSIKELPTMNIEKKDEVTDLYNSKYSEN